MQSYNFRSKYDTLINHFLKANRGKSGQTAETSGTIPQVDGKFSINRDDLMYQDFANYFESNVSGKIILALPQAFAFLAPGLKVIISFRKIFSRTSSLQS